VETHRIARIAAVWYLTQPLAAVDGEEQALSVGLAGRAIAFVGIVVGLVAIGLPLVTAGGISSRYVDDGTVFAFLVITLAYASYFPAEIGRDMAAAAVGSTAFGFYLFFPAILAFDRLGNLGAGGWLGICTILIPIGALIVRSTESKPAAEATSSPGIGLAQLAAAVGLVLIVIGIWLPAGSGDNDASYWNVSHTLGALMLLLVVLNVLFIGATLFSTVAAADLALLVAATTFGLVEANWIVSAFEDFGTMGAGAWLQTIGGVFLVLGVAAVHRAAEPAPAHAATAASAS
jgi:hypothetical protein